MWQRVQTLRFKIAALNLVAFGAILAVLWGALLSIREEFVRSDFDRRLSEIAEDVSEELDLSPKTVTATAPSDRTWPPLIPFRLPGYFFQLRRVDGSIVERSRRLQEVALPLSERAAAQARAGSLCFETLEEETATTLLGPDGELRMLTMYHRPATGAPYYLQVAVSFEPVSQSIRHLQRLLLALGLSGMAAVGLASWIMARRSLAPIGRIAREAQALTAEHLDRRIAMPSGSDEVAVMVATINQMLDRLEAAFQAQERFIADISHELKTPLSILLGQAQVLGRQERAADDYRQFVRSVEEEMHRLARAVDSLLTLARARAGFPISFAAPVSPNDLVADAVQRCRLLAAERSVRLVPVLAMPGPGDVIPTILGDEELLGSMLTNLLRNAIRFSPSGAAIEIAVTLDGEHCRIAVRDRGPGIASELLPRVFDGLYGGLRSRDGQGAGLGLSIARGVAELHGGRISAANRPDGGAEFVVELPLAREADLGGPDHTTHY